MCLVTCGRLGELEFEAWDCPSITKLNLFGCRQVSTACLQEVVRQASATLLTMDINGCTSVADLQMTGARRGTLREMRDNVLPGVHLATGYLFNSYPCPSALAVLPFPRGWGVLSKTIAKQSRFLHHVL